MSLDEDEWTVVAKDSNGNVLKDGDSVVVIKDLDYRFVVTAGAGRSCATATADACAYP